MQINKGDRVGLIGNANYKALKEFDVKDIISKFSTDMCFVEDTMTKSSSAVFLEQLTDWLLKNGYIKETTKAVVDIIVTDLHGDNPRIKVKRHNNEGRSDLSIPLLVDQKEVGTYTSSCRWQIDYSKPITSD